MKKKTSNRRLIFQLAAVVVLIVIAYAMTIVGRGHTVYFDNKKLEYNGETYRKTARFQRIIGANDRLI